MHNHNYVHVCMSCTCTIVVEVSSTKIIHSNQLVPPGHQVKFLYKKYFGQYLKNYLLY